MVQAALLLVTPLDGLNEFAYTKAASLFFTELAIFRIVWLERFDFKFQTYQQM